MTLCGHSLKAANENYSCAVYVLSLIEFGYPRFVEFKRRIRQRQTLRKLRDAKPRVLASSEKKRKSPRRTHDRRAAEQAPAKITLMKKRVAAQYAGRHSDLRMIEVHLTMRGAGRRLCLSIIRSEGQSTVPGKQFTDAYGSLRVFVELFLVSSGREETKDV
jgi:hypothetical protein